MLKPLENKTKQKKPCSTAWLWPQREAKLCVFFLVLSHSLSQVLKKKKEKMHFYHKALREALMESSECKTLVPIERNTCFPRNPWRYTLTACSGLSAGCVQSSWMLEQTASTPGILQHLQQHILHSQRTPCPVPSPQVNSSAALLLPWSSAMGLPASSPDTNQGSHVFLILFYG